MAACNLIFVVKYQLYIATVLEGLDPAVAECFASRLARACCPTSDDGPIDIVSAIPVSSLQDPQALCR